PGALNESISNVFGLLVPKAYFDPVTRYFPSALESAAEMLRFLLTNRCSQGPLGEITSACLPQHPAVASLFFVRPTQGHMSCRRIRRKWSWRWWKTRIWSFGSSLFSHALSTP